MKITVEYLKSKPETWLSTTTIAAACDMSERAVLKELLHAHYVQQEGGNWMYYKPRCIRPASMDPKRVPDIHEAAIRVAIRINKIAENEAAPGNLSAYDKKTFKQLEAILAFKDDIGAAGMDSLIHSLDRLLARLRVVEEIAQKARTRLESADPAEQFETSSRTPGGTN